MSRLAFNTRPSVVVATGGLSTSSPHPTEGVKDAEELPMVGVKHLLNVWIPTTAHILETKSELEKDLWSSKICY